MLIMLRLLSF